MAEPNATIAAIVLKVFQTKFPTAKNISDKTTLSSLKLTTSTLKETMYQPIVDALAAQDFASDALQASDLDDAKTVGDVEGKVVTAVLSSHSQAVEFHWQAVDHHMKEVKRHISKLRHAK